MRVTNHPTDTELLDALEKLLSQTPRGIVNIQHKGGLLFRVGNATMEVDLRIAMRVYLQRHKLLPESIVGD